MLPVVGEFCPPNDLFKSLPHQVPLWHWGADTERTLFLRGHGTLEEAELGLGVTQVPQLASLATAPPNTLELSASSVQGPQQVDGLPMDRGEGGL